MLGEPCRNFNILNYIEVIDPMDGRQKLALSNFAAGSTGSVILVDPVSGEGENIVLPGDSGAWALLNLNDERLLVGTCAEYGYVHSLDLATRTWAEPLRIESETYIWNFALGSDGMVYGGTYPGCMLLRYDPQQHALTSVGRASDEEGNLYCRQVRGGVPGWILTSGGFDKPFMRAYDIKSGQFRDFGIPGAAFRHVSEQGICLEREGELHCFDARTWAPLAPGEAARLTLPPTFRHPEHSDLRAVSISGERWAGVRGQDYFVTANGEQEIELRRIPVEAPSTHIHTLVSDEQGRIWGATTFGQTLFSYDPKSEQYWNSGIVCNNGGEVYGMQFLGCRLFMSAYAGGDHIVYDTSRPWDQLRNINPQTLRSVSPDLIRPTGRTVAGPDGAIWSGWSAKYGTYGGGLSRIDPVSLEVASWYDPIPGQQVAGLDADDRYLYFSTNGGASGLAYKEEPCHFAVFSPDGEVVSQYELAPEVRAGQVIAAAGSVLIASGRDLLVYDTRQGEFQPDIQLERSISWMVKAGRERVAIFAGENLILLDMRDKSVTPIATLPGTVQAACVTPDLQLYFASGTTLYRLEQSLFGS